MHRIPWTKGKTYEEILGQYLAYVKARFPIGTIVAFDGYSEDLTTKGVAHRKRSKCSEKEVQFNLQMKLSIRIPILQEKQDSSYLLSIKVTNERRIC